MESAFATKSGRNDDDNYGHGFWLFLLSIHRELAKSVHARLAIYQSSLAPLLLSPGAPDVAVVVVDVVVVVVVVVVGGGGGGGGSVVQW